VIASLNPSEDYKTSILSGLSPILIMECASRGLAFHSYQTSQEIIYQEHLAKGLTEKYNTLSQQMDQLIHDGNAQIKALQDKMQGKLRPLPPTHYIADCASSYASRANGARREKPRT
jgi:CRISPR/Cas system endoribonuclease Cas6 (RAMP superfamily)